MQVYRNANVQHYKDHPALANPGPVIQRLRNAILKAAKSKDRSYVRRVTILSMLSIYACSPRPSQVKMAGPKLAGLLRSLLIDWMTGWVFKCIG